MHRALLVPLALVLACDSGGGSEVVDTRIVVFGNDMGPLSQIVTLSRANSAVSNAQVTVNGTTLTETVAGRYSGQLPAFLAVGDTIRIAVISGIDTIIGVATVPTVPSLVVPGNGTAIHIPTPLDFSWFDSTDPDEFRAAIQYSGVSETAGFPGNARAGIVVTSRIPVTATNLSAYLYAYNDGTFTGPAHPNSKMHVRQSGGVVGLVVGP
jgi:hypothetical protein